MPLRRASIDPLPLLAALIGVLLLGLALLQHQWLSEVSVAERARMKANAAERAEAIARDLDREVTRAFLMLGVEADAVRRRDLASYPEAFAAWKARAAYPDLVADVWVVDGERPDARAHLLRFDPASGRFDERAAPVDLTPVLEKLTPQAMGGRAATPTALDSVDGAVPALLIPAPHRAPAPDLVPGAKRDQLFVIRPDAEPATWTVVRLDREALARHVLPDLARRHASTPDGAEYHVTVLGPGAGPGEASLVWRSDPAAPAGESGADASARALAVRFDDIDAAILSKLVPDPAAPPAVPAHAAARRVFSFRIASGLHGPAAGRSPWTVALFHRAGSVDAAVAATQRRSAVVAGSVLLLLAGSAALVVASARRERRLATRQLEFVAAVSHELRTPLTVIRSAAENLRDGVVVEPARVREYGAVLREEGRRLTDMVEQVLAFAGADASSSRPRVLDLERLVPAAVADAGLAAAGLDVRVEVEPGLCVRGDEAMLAAALRNLLINLRKYAAEGGYAGVSARAGGGAVEIVVEDRGPGIPPDERRRVFEPFFRGRRAAESQAPGSGIGLALVRRIAEAHGGTVEARPLERGMAFAIRLPAAGREPDPQGAPAREGAG
jgi:signal transduction histidine kinase